MNKFKRTVEKALKLYFIEVTLITVLLMVLGLAFDSDRTFSYQAYASPLIYAVIGTLPVILFERDKELSVKQMLVKNIAELAIIEAAVLFIAFSVDTIPTERKEIVIGIAVGIVVVFVITALIDYLFEMSESRNLNRALARYQEKNTFDT